MSVHAYIIYLILCIMFVKNILGARISGISYALSFFNNERKIRIYLSYFFTLYLLLVTGRCTCAPVF